MINASPPENAFATDYGADETPQRLVPIRRRLDTGHSRAAEPESEPTETAGLPADSSECTLPSAADEVTASNPAALLDLELPAPELLAAAAGETLEAEREHVQLQVAQLAAHLRERLRELDRREGQLNARAAQFEADQRAAALGSKQREDQFQQRENELSAAVAELQSQLAQAMADQREAAASARSLAALNVREEELSQREQQLAADEQALMLRAQEADLREQERLAHRERMEQDAATFVETQQALQAETANRQQGLANEREHIANAAARIAEREAELATLEEKLNRQASQFDYDEAEWTASRKAWAERTSEQERAFQERQKALQAEWDDRRLRLDARQDWLERQKTSLEQARADILHLHRQSLEMRLLAEQLWSQISERLSPAEVTRRIAQLKLKLTEHYRLEEEGLDARKAELVALGERIAAQYEELSQLRSGLREWAAARQAEIEQQAAALVQRELELDEQQEELRRQRQQRQAERWRSELASERAEL